MIIESNKMSEFVYHYVTEGRWSGGVVRGRDEEHAVVRLMTDHPSVASMRVRITHQSDVEKTSVFHADRPRVDKRDVFVTLIKEG